MVIEIEGRGFHFGDLLLNNRRIGKCFENHILRLPADRKQYDDIARMLRRYRSIDERSVRFINAVDSKGDEVTVYSLPRAPHKK